MFHLSDRWPPGRAELLILAGAVVGVGGNAASLAWAIATQPSPAWSVALSVFGLAIGLSILAALVISRRKARTSRNFALVAAVATPLAVLSYAGLIGGGLVLAGATWGIVNTYKAHP